MEDKARLPSKLDIEKGGKMSLHHSNVNQIPNLKWMSLIYFVFQNVFLAIGIRICHEFSDPFHPYISSTAVMCTESTKLFLSIFICFFHDAQGDIWQFGNIAQKAFLEEGADLLKLLVPALLYCIQNNLQYVIDSAPLFLVMYQLKIITTAIFYSSLLQRRISNKEWLSIMILAIGVGMVQSSQREFLPHHASNVIGIISVAFACITSGMAGVFFEKTIKQSKTSIWMINVQMSLLSCVLSMVSFNFFLQRYFL
jgi:UDP-sugar transporter A1/2/3